MRRFKKTQVVSRSSRRFKKDLEGSKKVKKGFKRFKKVQKGSRKLKHLVEQICQCKVMLGWISTITYLFKKYYKASKIFNIQHFVLHKNGIESDQDCNGY